MPSTGNPKIDAAIQIVLGILALFYAMLTLAARTLPSSWAFTQWAAKHASDGREIQQEIGAQKALVAVATEEKKKSSVPPA